MAEYCDVCNSRNFPLLGNSQNPRFIKNFNAISLDSLFALRYMRIVALPALTRITSYDGESKNNAIPRLDYFVDVARSNTTAELDCARNVRALITSVFCCSKQQWFHPCIMQATLIDDPNIPQRGNGSMNAQDDPHQTMPPHEQNEQHYIHAAKWASPFL